MCLRIAHKLRAKIDHLAATQPLGMDTATDPVTCLQNDDRGAVRPEVPGRGQSGETCADHDDICRSIRRGS
jgi:hypothetical protein